MFDNRIIPNSLVRLFKPSLHRAIRRTRSVAMISRNRMQNLHRLLADLNRRESAGDIVETGVAAGGSAVFIGLLVRDHHLPREIWLYDAFDLLPEYGTPCRTVRQRIYEEFGFSESKMHVVPGFFHETLPHHPHRPIALLHIDTAPAEAVQPALEHLVPFVVPGGWVVFDNYGADASVRSLVDGWLQERAITGALQRFGHTQAYVQLS